MSENTEFKKDGLRITATGDDNGSICSQTVEALLLFSILEKLEEIRMGVIDVENEINKSY